MSRFHTLVIFLFVALVSAASHPAERWQVSGRAGLSTPIHLHIFLQNEDKHTALQEVASNIADPSHGHFRQHLSAEDVQVLLHPGERRVRDVTTWLGDAGIDEWNLHGDILEVKTTIGDVEQLLGTEYYLYTSEEGDVIARTESYTLPQHLEGTISHITPTTSFALSRPRKDSSNAAMKERRSPLLLPRAASSNSACNTSSTTPTCIRSLYGLNYTATPNRTTFAVYATEGAAYSGSDLDVYMSSYNPAGAKASYTLIGAGNSSETSGIEGAFETALDTQTAMGLAYPANGILYNFGGVFGPTTGPVYDPFVTFLTQLATNKSVPGVVSFSEGMPEDHLPASYATHLCTLMAAVGARGTTLLFSSGDNGPQGDTPMGAHNGTFEPEFPASCPWVLAVGGTTLDNAGHEVAATQSTLPTAAKVDYIASGGGFSRIFAAPAWQSNITHAYIANHIPPSYLNDSSFNAQGRGYPDVSALSANFPTVWHGFTVPVSGTSASTPTWAAILTLLNDYESSHNRPGVGFATPWLYSLGNGALTDITGGGNNIGECRLLEGCVFVAPRGFNVTEGWDPVTGLGSPNWSGLVDALDQRAQAVKGVLGGLCGDEC